MLLRWVQTEVDKAHKDKKHKMVSEDFCIELFFDVPIPPSLPEPDEVRSPLLKTPK